MCFCYFHNVVYETDILSYLATFNKASLIRVNWAGELGMEVLVRDTLQLP